MDAIREAVNATLASVAPGTDPGAIAPDRPLREQIDLDSLDWLNVIAELNERIGIDIPDADHERLATVDAMVAYLAARAGSPRREAPGIAALAPLPQSRHRINGVPVEIRPMRPDDKPLEADFVRRLSSDARYERFMATLRELSPAKLAYLTEVDQVRHVALVAVAEREGQPAFEGVARYAIDPAGTGCEFAIAVSDDWQGSGVAGVLMHALIGLARARGLATMEGIVLAANTRMLRFTRQLGFVPQHDPGERGTLRVVRALRAAPPPP